MIRRPWLTVSKVFLCIAALSVSSGAQETSRNFLGLGFGGSDVHLKDGHASPMIFGNIGIAPSLKYIYRGSDSRQYIEGSYYYEYLGTSNENFHTASRGGRIRYSYLRKISNVQILRGDFELFLGGSVNSYLAKSDYYYQEAPPLSQGTTIMSWYWSHSVDVAAQLEYNPGEREFLSVQVMMPTVSNVSRPQYSSSGDYNYDENYWKMKAFGETVFFPSNFSVDALVMYQRSLAGNFNLQVDYEFSYASYDKPSDIGMYMNNFRAGVFFCF